MITAGMVGMNGTLVARRRVRRPAKRGGRRSGDEPRGLWAGLAAVDRGFSAPLGGEESDGAVDVLVESEQVADEATVLMSTVEAKAPDKSRRWILPGRTGLSRSISLRQAWAAAAPMDQTRGWAVLRPHYGATPTRTSGTDGTPRPWRTTFIRSRSKYGTPDDISLSSSFIGKISMPTSMISAT